MARKRKQESRVNPGRIPVFKERINMLERSYPSVANFADRLGISDKTVGFWLNGDRVPDAENLKIIRDRLGVSIDWLLGYEDVDKPKSDTAIRTISEYTGLSHDAIEILHFLQENNREESPAKKTLSSLSRLLKDELFYFEILDEINSFFQYSDQIDLDVAPQDDFDVFSDDDYRMIRAFQQKGFIVQSVRDAAQHKAEATGASLTEYLNGFTQKLPGIAEVEEGSRRIKVKLWHKYIVGDYSGVQDYETEEAQQHGNDNETDE